ncbi:MAG: hypothetical protein U0Z44_07020 [Kouleothrix sp.]
MGSTRCLAVRPLYLYGTDYDEQVQAGGMHRASARCRLSRCGSMRRR